MRDALQVIKERRSIRAYKPEQIKDEELNAILEAGLYAPSAMNQQSWHLTVVQNQGVMDRMTQEMKEQMKHSANPRFQQMAESPDFSAFYHAPTVIIVSGEEKALLAQVDCAVANENMLLAAEAQGIGSCWINMVTYFFTGEKGEAWKKELGIPEGYKPMCAAAYGYKAMEMQAPPRKENPVNYVK